MTTDHRESMCETADSVQSCLQWSVMPQETAQARNNLIERELMRQKCRLNIA